MRYLPNRKRSLTPSTVSAAKDTLERVSYKAHQLANRFDNLIRRSAEQMECLPRRKDEGFSFTAFRYFVSVPWGFYIPRSRIPDLPNLCNIKEKTIKTVLMELENCIAYSFPSLFYPHFLLRLSEKRIALPTLPNSLQLCIYRCWTRSKMEGTELYLFS